MIADKHPSSKSSADSAAAPNGSTPRLPRRLAAMVYDLLLLIALLFVFTLLVLLLRGGREIPPGTWWFELSLLAVAAAFFVWFWTHGGQTLGMRAWRLRVIDRQGENLRWPRALGRFAAALVSTAPAGLGFLWSLVDREGLCWHDRLSGSRLVMTPKRRRDK